MIDHFPNMFLMKTQMNEKNAFIYCTLSLQFNMAEKSKMVAEVLININIAATLVLKTQQLLGPMFLVKVILQYGI